MNWLHYALFSHSVAIVFLGYFMVIALRKSAKATLDWIFVALLANFAAWIGLNAASQTLTATGRVSDIPGTVGGWVVQFMVFLAFVFCEYFPQGVVLRFAKLRIVVMGAFGLGAAALTLSPQYISNRRFVNGAATADYGPFFALHGSWAAFVVFAAVGLLLFKYARRIRDPKQRAQTRDFMGGAVACTVLVVIFALALPLLGYDRLFFLGPDGAVVLISFVIYSVIAHQMFDLRTAALRYGFRVLLSFLIGLFAHMAFLALLVPGAAPFSWPLAIGSGLLFLAGLLFGQVVLPGIDARLFESRVRTEDILADILIRRDSFYYREPIESFLQDIIDTIVRRLRAGSGVILVQDRFRRLHARSVGPMPAIINELNPTLVARWSQRVQMLPAFLEATHRVVSIGPAQSIPIEEDPTALKRYSVLVELFRVVVRGLGDAGFQLLVPLVYRQEIAGYLILGGKGNGLPSYGGDLGVINAIRAPLALAIRNHLDHEAVRDLKTDADREIDRLTDLIASKATTRHEMPGRVLVYRSDVMRHAIEQVQVCARNNRPVLITGETGTGKELAARLMHGESERKAEPFVAINCAAIPTNLWEDEIFGHVKGAFTDARSDRRGRVAEAGRGTLFFDEIGELPLEMQSKMLRLLQERRFAPLGGGAEQDAECRFVFASNRNLEDMISEGTFREDLFYRISVFHIHLPPLRERREDIAVLTDALVAKLAPELQVALDGIDDAALRALCAYAWPGNVRQLENILIRALSSVTTGRLRSEDLPLALRMEGQAALSHSPVRVRRSADSVQFPIQLETILNQSARSLIEKALAEAGGNKSKAAELLGITRNKLRHQLRVLRIE